MEELTKREKELLSIAIIHEVDAIKDFREHKTLLAQSKRVSRERENEYLQILRKLLTDKTSM